MNEQDDILIDQYLSGELSAEERQAFERRLGEDAELARALTLRRGMDQFLARREARPALQRQLQELGVEYFGKEEARVAPIGRRRLWSLAAAVAVLVVAVFVWRWVSSPSLYEEYAQHPPLALVEKSAAGPDLSATEQAFNKGDYSTALTGLEQYLDRQPQDTLALLYKGICAMELGQTVEAQAIFSSLQNSPSWQEYGDWYLALSHLKQQRDDEAKAALQRIPEASPYHPQAQELLSRLR